ncbi:class I SAM-dependent methyltransferase [Kamptonema cortianum]|nr:class I SAM-dependent methyltransferase [Geitlerinema splendidum]MDK3158666.1 class I SAM-dependent methyltransferase [Kamptonema cortianum]
MTLDPVDVDFTWELKETRSFLQSLGFADSAQFLQQARTYLTALYTANATTNLTRVPANLAEERHILDSLLLLKFLPEGSRLVDIGSGPGIPGWFVAAVRPDVQVCCVESNGKFARFLRSQPLPNLTVLEQRAEIDPMEESFNVATGRAVAPFGIQAELSAPWLKIGGRLLPFRTPSEQEDIERANVGMLGLKLTAMHEVPLPGSDVVRLFPEFEKVRSTDPNYPRTWAKIKAKPLGR